MQLIALFIVFLVGFAHSQDVAACATNSVNCLVDAGTNLDSVCNCYSTLFQCYYDADNANYAATYQAACEVFISPNVCNTGNLNCNLAGGGSTGAPTNSVAAYGASFALAFLGVVAALF
jgi:hypothetical protein